MFVQNLDHVRELLGSLNGSLIGVGMTAFSRIIPAFFLDSYRIVSLRNTGDLSLLRQKAGIFCLEEKRGWSADEKGQNSALLLSDRLVRDYLAELPDPKHLMLYQSYPELEILAGREGWRLLTNRADLRIHVGQRSFFEKMVADLGLYRIPGGIYPVSSIHRRVYEEWADALGPGFVVQLPEIGQGGGRGTFFVRSQGDYRLIQERLKEDRWRGVPLNSVSVHRFERGVPASVAICLTRQGTLVSGLQRQLIDLPYCRDFPEAGIFCGHVWEEASWSSAIRREARKQADMIGEYLSHFGYKGIFGVDFVVNEEDQRVCPIEINPRLTGAFPMLSLQHLKNGIMPMEVFHILEFSGLSYRIDVRGLNHKYARPVRGSHLLLFLPSSEGGVRVNRLKPGLYEYDPVRERFFFVKGALEYREIQNQRQFIIVDGPVRSGGRPIAFTDPFFRLCHMLFSYPVAGQDGSLFNHALLALEWVYEKTMGASSL